MWQPSFTIQELEFFTSLKTEVTILPNFSLKEEIFLLRVTPFLPRGKLALLRRDLKPLSPCGSPFTSRLPINAKSTSLSGSRRATSTPSPKEKRTAKLS